MKNTILTIIFLTFSFYLAIALSAVEAKAQSSPKTDSLFTILKTAKADTTLVSIYNKLSWEYRSSNPDTALYFANSALKLALRHPELVEWKKGMADSYNNIGLIHANKGDYDKAIDFYFKSLKTYEELGRIHPKLVEWKKGMSASYNNIGIIHTDKGDYDKAIDFYFKSLKIKEELGDKQGMASSYDNIGIIHFDKGNYDKALEFYFKSLKIREELGHKKGMAASYNNIGLIHANKSDYDMAIEFYFKALKINEEIGNKNWLANNYNNIGIIHENKGDYDKAIEYYFKSLKIKEELGNKQGMAISYTNIGSLYLMQGKPEEAKKQQLLALNIAKEIGYKKGMYYAYYSLAQCDSALGNFKGAYEYHKLYSQVHDSVFSKESNDKIAEMGAKYEAEKRELTIQKLEKEKQLQNETLARKEAESKKQRILLFSFLAGFIIILVFSVFLYRLFVQKKKANIILAQQKEEISAQRDEIETQRDLVTQQKEHIEHIHEEQTDSIRYAERIQRAMLPNLAVIASVAKQSKDHSMQQIASPLVRNDEQLDFFILFKPKDIVSGDFYYIAQRKNTLLIAVADCTGHGVPGAFMSMLGISFLNEIIAKEEIQSASHVLNELRQYVINSLQQKGMVGEQQDGMDIAFIALNTETLELQFAGANNPCYIIANTQPVIAMAQPEAISTAQSDCFVPRNDDCQLIEPVSELVELKGDKMPIGIYSKIQPFTNQIFQLQKNDTIYLMSDGYEDQFGGPQRKKFLAKNFKNLLIANSQKPMAEQKENLNNTFENWKGNSDQIDDVTVMGIKIK